MPGPQPSQDIPTHVCFFCGLQRPETVMARHTVQPVSKTRGKLPPVWYCTDKNHPMTQVDKMVNKVRP